MFDDEFDDEGRETLETKIETRKMRKSSNKLLLNIDRAKNLFVDRKLLTTVLERNELQVGIVA